MRAVKACVRCVGVLALASGAKAQVYASRSSWNVQGPEETPHRSKPIPSLLASHPIILTYLFASFSPSLYTR